MSTFLETISPTPFGFFDSDPEFQTEADGMVIYVKRKLGDDVLSVELTKKQIWQCFEEAICEYSRLVHEMKIQSELINVLGLPTASTDLTNVYPRQSLDYLVRQAEPYASEAYVGGVYDTQLGYIDLVPNKQDYNLYTDIKETVSGSNLWTSIASTERSRIKIVELFHFEPLAAQQMLLNASNITNFLATAFNYESYVNSTVFYVLPVFEDVLRRGMLETATRVRRSNYSYQTIGSNLRIYPLPSTNVYVTPPRLYIRVSAKIHNSVKPDIGGGLGSDESLYGISGPSNFPVSNLPYTSITQPGRQWIRQYTFTLCREILGIIRTKFSSIPIPGSEVQLNGQELLNNAREDREKLRDQLREWLMNLTNSKLLEQQATAAEQLNKQLKYIPMPLGKAIIIG